MADAWKSADFSITTKNLNIMTQSPSISAMEQFSIAIQTLALRNKRDRFGNDMVTSDNIAWAKDYLSRHMRFIHKKAKSFIRKWQDEARRKGQQMAGNYSDAIASAWHYLKNVKNVIAKKLSVDTETRQPMRVKAKAFWIPSDNKIQRCPDVSGQIYASKFVASQNQQDAYKCAWL